MLNLAGCSDKVDPIVLPDAAQIHSVDVAASGQTVSHTDPAWIHSVIAGLSDSRPTGKESIQDAPEGKPYTKLDFHFSKGASAVFVYPENGSYYVEQPYQGIYEIDSSVYTQICGSP